MRWLSSMDQPLCAVIIEGKHALRQVGNVPSDLTRITTVRAIVLRIATEFLEHVRRLIDGEIIWAPAITGAFVLTTRGGDFGLYIGEDVSIGYLSHNDKTVRLYLEETFTFLLLTTEASVALSAPARKSKS